MLRLQTTLCFSILLRARRRSLRTFEVGAFGHLRGRVFPNLALVRRDLLVQLVCNVFSGCLLLLLVVPMRFFLCSTFLEDFLELDLGFTFNPGRMQRFEVAVEEDLDAVVVQNVSNLRVRLHPIESGLSLLGVAFIPVLHRSVVLRIV